jgi:tRNA threonylcarbamoyl adenosine modification protein YeaZ
MIFLTIETSTDRGFIALFKDNHPLYKKKLPFGLQNSKSLFPEIDMCFKETGLKPQDINAIGVGIGPGSYTGIRVGAMAAKTLAFALKVPLIGICSLSNFIPSTEGTFASLIDARIGGVYLQTASFEQGSVKNLSEPKLYSIEDAACIIKNCRVVITPNMGSIKQKFEKLQFNTFLWQESDPDIEHMYLTMLTAYEKGEFKSDQTLDLLYLRKTQAEIESNR